MNSQKNLLIFLQIVMLLSQVFLSYAEETPYMYYKESEKIDSVAVVDTGYVVINGELLRPPFYMELKNDTIWINNAAASPVLEYPTSVQSNPLYPLPFKLDSLQQKLVDDIKNQYKQHKGEFGEKTAMEMVVSEYQSDPLLSTLTIYESEVSTAFDVFFTDGTHINIPVNQDLTKLK